jgi:hypothetical protein
MVEIDLTISDRLSATLPPLTDEEKARLEANIVADGRIIDPILYWTERTGQHRNVVLDGMNRLPIARRLGVPYHCEPMPGITTYEAAEIWILDHALGQRNIADPQKLRQIRGDLYNKMKGDHGGDRSSSESRNLKPGRAAEEVAEKAGVAPSTVTRDGARMETVDKCAPGFAKGLRSQAFKATDDQIRLVAGLPTDAQEAIAREARFGKTVAAAIEKVTGKPAKKPPKKPKPEPAAEVSEAEKARFTVESWATTIGAMLSKSPTIDEYRNQWPGEKGDRVVKLASELHEALKNWKKAIK